MICSCEHSTSVDGICQNCGKPISEVLEGNDFELFQQEFKKWQYLFGLTGYRVYFKYEPLEDRFADITVEQSDMVATVRLSNNLPDKAEPHRSVKQSAKHEAIHLLLHRLESLGRCRYIGSEEIYEATEELVFKLEGLITGEEN